MPTSEDKDRSATLARLIDLELRHSYDDDHHRIFRLLKEMHNSSVDLTLRLASLEERLGTTEPVMVPRD